MDKLCVIIPAYNEGSRLSDVVSKIKKYTKNIVIVDDGSSDNTLEVSKKTGFKVLHHILNLGKGAAMKTGCDYAIREGFDNIILIDADGQHNPDDIPKFSKALENNDIVFGVRRLDKNMPTISRFGNWFISKITSFLYKIKLYDTQCGYRAFTRETYKKIRWDSTDYAVESEMIANAGNVNLKYSTIVIDTIYLDKYKGTTPSTGIKIVLSMLAWKFKKRNTEK